MRLDSKFEKFNIHSYRDYAVYSACLNVYNLEQYHWREVKYYPIVDQACG